MWVGRGVLGKSGLIAAGEVPTWISDLTADMPIAAQRAGQDDLNVATGVAGHEKRRKGNPQPLRDRTRSVQLWFLVQTFFPGRSRLRAPGPTSRTIQPSTPLDPAFHHVALSCSRRRSFRNGGEGRGGREREAADAAPNHDTTKPKTRAAGRFRVAPILSHPRRAAAG